MHQQLIAYRMHADTYMGMARFCQLFKPRLRCLQDFELEIKFRSDATPVFCNGKPVSFAIPEDLNDAYEAGIGNKV